MEPSSSSEETAEAAKARQQKKNLNLREPLIMQIILSFNE